MVSKGREELGRWGGEHILSEEIDLNKGPEVRTGMYMGRQGEFIVPGA